MSLRIGEEFAIKAGSEEWWRKHRYLDEIGSDSVLTANPDRHGHLASSRRTGGFDFMQIMEQQRQRIADLNTRLNDLDRKSDENLRAAQERLAEILRTANKTKDGRAVFQDEDGKFYDQYDNEVSADEVDLENWNPDAWTRNDFHDALQAEADARAFQAKVDDLQERTRGPLTDEHLAAIDSELTELESSMPEFSGMEWTASSDRSTSAAKLYDDAPSALTISSPFERAASTEMEEPAGPPRTPPLTARLAFD